MSLAFAVPRFSEIAQITVAVIVSVGGLFAALSLRDPLSAATLTSAQRSAGYRSAELEVAGENCRFCRINVERALKEVPGVKVAKADMAHHRARIVYDPRIVQPAALAAAVREAGVGAKLPSESPLLPGHG